MLSKETYPTILNWIIRQQEYEATHSAPAPLTEIQRKLLEKLELTLPPTTPPLPSPEIGEDNWIGLLLEYRAARQRVPEGLPGGDFFEKPGPTVGNLQKWYCEVQIPEHPAPFPGPHGGFLEDGTQPSFARKKDAKKYAAKCAVLWLRSNGYIAGYDGNGAKRPQVPAQAPAPAPVPVPVPAQAPAQAQEHQITPQSSPTSKKQKLSKPSPKSPQASRPEPNAVQTLPGSPLPKGIASPFNNEEVSAAYKATQLCTRLGFPNLPRYNITENPDMTGFYSGRPALGLLASELPEEAGCVENVIGRKAAKEKMAEDLLVHLQKLIGPHEEKKERYLAGLPPLKSKREERPAPA